MAGGGPAMGGVSGGSAEGGFDAAGRWRDARGRFARLPRPAAAAPPPRRYRLTVFGEPRGEWHSSSAALMAEAIALGLASWDAARREHYLAVPVSVQTRG